ncbi:MAG: Acetyltransferase (GNAT) domain protein [Candidatus Argoarchaeum ethanivorans]|uniref:Acetyltransferase (GNAT) domain protein n=1 Tax=Candidatus Argoarchaeum ethanivorans TaxID=2608793 RepID=A0A812A0R2_9EURY|nr:MAG: Acetyltransferase (GNAT) domain protein [Candidatus Argoarchaeum ethanivorans]
MWPQCFDGISKRIHNVESFICATVTAEIWENSVILIVEEFKQMKIRTIEKIEDLQTVREYWECLQTHPNSDFAHFKLVCKQRKTVICPYITVIEQRSKPCALLVARLEQTHFVPSIGYFKTVRIPAKILMVIHQGFLGQKNKKVGEMLIQHLGGLLATGKVDAVVFSEIQERSILLDELLADSLQWWSEKKFIWDVHWAMDLPEVSGFLLKKMKSKHRSWIRGRRRKLEADFPNKVSWSWMSRFDDLPGLCDKLEEVASITYQRALGAGFVNNEEQRQRFALFASRGQLRIQLLEVEAEIKAFWIGTIYHGVFYSAATGYHPDFRFYEFGTLIFLQMVDELVKEGVKKLDFGFGDASYKKRFGDIFWRETTVRLFAPTLKGMSIRICLGACDLLDRAGRSLVQRAGMMDRVKTGWRRRLNTMMSKVKRK